MAGGGRGGLTSQIFCRHSCGSYMIYIAIPPDHIQVTVGVHAQRVD